MKSGLVQTIAVQGRLDIVMDASTINIEISGSAVEGVMLGGGGIICHITRGIHACHERRTAALLRGANVNVRGDIRELSSELFRCEIRVLFCYRQADKA